MLIAILVLAAVLITLPGFLFVSLVWTHRPDLSVMDILREAVQEIKNSCSQEKRP